MDPRPYQSVVVPGEQRPLSFVPLVMGTPVSQDDSRQHPALFPQLTAAVFRGNWIAPPDQGSPSAPLDSVVVVAGFGGAGAAHAERVADAAFRFCGHQDRRCRLALVASHSSPAALQVMNALAQRFGVPGYTLEQLRAQEEWAARARRKAGNRVPCAGPGPWGGSRDVSLLFNGRVVSVSPELPPSTFVHVLGSLAAYERQARATTAVTSRAAGLLGSLPPRQADGASPPSSSGFNTSVSLL